MLHPPAPLCLSCRQPATLELRTQYGVWVGLYCAICGEREEALLLAWEAQYTLAGAWTQSLPRT